MENVEGWLNIDKSMFKEALNYEQGISETLV